MTTIDPNVFVECFRKVETFNKISGNLDPKKAHEKIDLYLSLSFEEFTESVNALESGDAVELLDGLIDEWVILMGRFQIMVNTGFDVTEALKRVCDNNLTKFPQEVDESKLKPGIRAEKLTEIDGYKLVNEAGKIQKPANYKPVVLNDLVPYDFFN